MQLLLILALSSQETEFVPNMVRTSKYEYYNFLPKFLWEEFNPSTKIANVYFLFIAVLQVRWASNRSLLETVLLLPYYNACKWA